MIKNVLIASMLLASAAVVPAASAEVLTFDALTTTYGDGFPLGPNMTGNSQFMSYVESGYVLTLNTTNAPDYFVGAHIGDGTGVAQTYNWHDGADNAPGAFVTLTKADGGSFNLNSFDYASDGGLTVASFNFAAGSGTFMAGLNNVTSVSFYGPSNNQLDNINVTGGAGAVPEPATWAMMIGGMGAVGGAMRRRRVSTKVSFA
jgi:hypothetical protein